MADETGNTRRREVLGPSLTRRSVLRGAATTFGTLALSPFLGGTAGAAPHFPARAKRVIYLTMVGGLSQTDLLDPKPALNRRDGEPCPDALYIGKNLAFIRERPALLGSPYAFTPRGQSGIEASELLPHFGEIADDVTLIRSMQTDEINHGPAEMLLLSGLGRFGRPSIGAWTNFALGSENPNLPAFVSMVSTAAQPASGSESWGAGFLPSRYQGVEFRSSGDPVLFLENPEGVSDDAQRATIDVVNGLNRIHAARVPDDETQTRIAQYEMAYRMQEAIPEAVDIWSEPEHIHRLYGTTPGERSLANQCLLARRLIERDVRFVQIFDCGWDHHTAIFEFLPMKARACDQAVAGLVLDLKQRGLLDDTLVVFTSEFGRTPVGQARSQTGAPAAVGRDHQRDAFTVWLAGAGVKSGFVYGETDELGHEVVRDPVHVHDLNATLLHLMGIDHERLTYRYQGRDFRLTDVHGKIVHDILA